MITRFGYARLDPSQQQLVRSVVAGQHVWDLGAGRGELTGFVRDHASHVTAIEKAWPCPEGLQGRVVWQHAYFQDVPVPESIDVALVSWPVNYPEAMYALVPFLRVAKRIIYIGVNDGMTACGTEELWNYLATRPFTTRIGSVEIYD